jgi:hypothetical protein
MKIELTGTEIAFLLNMLRSATISPLSQDAMKTVELIRSINLALTAGQTGVS